VDGRSGEGNKFSSGGRQEWGFGDCQGAELAAGLSIPRKPAGRPEGGLMEFRVRNSGEGEEGTPEVRIGTKGGPCVLAQVHERKRGEKVVNIPREQISKSEGEGCAWSRPPSVHYKVKKQSVLLTVATNSRGSPPTLRSARKNLTKVVLARNRRRYRSRDSRIRGGRGDREPNKSGATRLIESLTKKLKREIAYRLV